jgi:hypothetical protein
MRESLMRESRIRVMDMTRCMVKPPVTNCDRLQEGRIDGDAARVVKPVTDGHHPIGLLRP